MDTRTAQTLAALDGAAMELLIELLAGPATESHLVKVSGLGQSTANRRLRRMAGADLIEQAAGTRRQTGRVWTLKHPDETEQLLSAIVGLTRAAEAGAQTEREAVETRLGESAAARKRQLRSVS